MPSTGPRCPQKDPQMTRTLRAVIIGDRRNIARLHVLIARRRHLERARQVGPQLKAVHPPGAIALRHLLVDDAAARRHPLDIAGAERAAIAEAVAVIDRARQHVGDGLDAAVRMPGESSLELLRSIVAEVVEQQERIEVARVAEAEGAAEMDAGALDGRLRLAEGFDASD